MSCIIDGGRGGGYLKTCSMCSNVDHSVIIKKKRTKGNKCIQFTDASLFNTTYRAGGFEKSPIRNPFFLGHLVGFKLAARHP